MLSSDAIVTVMTVTERQQRDRARRRQAIITAARQLAEAEGWDAVTIRRLADQIEYSQPVLYSHFAGKADIIDAVAVEGFAELRLTLQNARAAAGTPEAALEELAEAYVGFALEHPALYDAMFTLSTELPFGRPETPRELQAAFGELVEAITPLAGERDPDTLAEVAWSALHGVATLTRARRLRPDHHQARLTMLVDQLADASSHPNVRR
jgi:AcrR family transcriptional regulator